MKHLLLGAVAAVLTLTTTVSHAGLLVEPVIGYNLGTSLDTELPLGLGKKDYKGSGVGYGGRLGFQKLGLQLGVDYFKSSLSMTSDDFDGNVDMDEWAGFVGYEFPILIRVYAGYIFSATGDGRMQGLSGLANAKLKLEDGTGYKLGVGFTGLPFVDINFEIRRGTFTDAKIGSVGIDDVDYQTYMIGASLPFNL
jgi:hypothetical protein